MVAIDSLVLPLVQMLNDAGFPTIGSCQGGFGHPYSLPTVQVQRPGDVDETRKSLCQFLLQQGFRGFSVKTIAHHQSTVEPSPSSYVEVELWSHRDLRGLTAPAASTKGE